MPSRRAFVQGLCALPVLSSLPRNGKELVYRATRNSIDVLRVWDGQSYKLQSLPTRNPGCLTRDISGSLLFAVNEISDYQGLPTGSVESYGIHPHSGKLTLLSRRQLSLSAIFPRSLAVSPDGRHVVVAIYGGGSYNVMSVNSNGELGPVSQTVKEIGFGPHELQSAAHPHSVVFHPSGSYLVTSDFGADRLSVFGFGDGRMTRRSYIQLAAGTGPAELTADWSQSRIFVNHHLSSSSSSYKFNYETGSLT